MSGHAILERPPRLREREEASLRRLTAHMRAEAQELPDDGWIIGHLDSKTSLWEWGERVLPELAAVMAAGTVEDPTPFSSRRSGEGPLCEEEEACMRRLAILLRAEAAELGGGSRIGERLDGWGVRLALVCEVPERPPRIG